MLSLGFCPVGAGIPGAGTFWRAFGPRKTLQCDRTPPRQRRIRGIRRWKAIKDLAIKDLGSRTGDQRDIGRRCPSLGPPLARLHGRQSRADGSPRHHLIAAATIAGAWFFQLVLGLVPCPLCLEQRYAYYLAIPLGVLVTIAAAKDAPRPVLLAGLAILTLAALGNAVLGGYHAGVEWKFFQGPTDCTGPIGQPRQRRQSFGTARHRKSDPLR